jgi:hypothetical protein
MGVWLAHAAQAPGGEHGVLRRQQVLGVLMLCLLL